MLGEAHVIIVLEGSKFRGVEHREECGLLEQVKHDRGVLLVSVCDFVWAIKMWDKLSYVCTGS